MCIISVLIVDDDRFVREGLGSILKAEHDIQVIGMSPSGAQALESALQLVPDVVILDGGALGIEGMEVARQIRRKLPDTGLIVLTVYDAFDHEALATGASKRLLKDCEPGQLIGAIRNVVQRSSSEALSNAHDPA